MKLTTPVLRPASTLCTRAPCNTLITDGLHGAWVQGADASRKTNESRASWNSVCNYSLSHKMGYAHYASELSQMWTNFNNFFTVVFLDELQKKGGIISTTSPKTCRCTTSRNLNVQLQSYSFILARTKCTSDLLR